jgi:[NiFe] hydrogenase diaphorase moiety large subunit
MSGAIDIAKVFEREVGRPFGRSLEDDPIGLEWTSCIGMNDQEPAAIVDGVIVTNLNPRKVVDMVTHLKKGGSPKDLVKKRGDGRNASELVNAMVVNNIRKKGEVLLADREVGSGLKRAVAMERSQVLDEVKKSNLKGRGGAGFPCGLKWEFCLKSPGKIRYLLCNADEGEPGTFKDRVLLTEYPELVFEGMAIAGYALGAEEGILYLRGEYAYLRAMLEDTLNRMRNSQLLGRKILNRGGVDFDIRIQVGAGAYVCGEETALIESCEGKRGEPRDRPPFPVTRGYLDYPSVVNNVETLCCAARILEKGADWFKSFGTEKSAGTKLLSVSGDCKNPGVYEFPFGITLNDFLKEVRGSGGSALQVGGPSGECVAPKDFGRKIAFEDLPTGGSMIVFGPDRKLFDAVRDFMEFFVEESCGRCTPCRVGNRLLLNRFNKVAEGRGVKSDLKYMQDLGNVIKIMSRCGLGLTSAHPVLTTMRNFPELYEKVLTDEEFIPEFDLEKAMMEGRAAAGLKQPSGNRS